VFLAWAGNHFRTAIPHLDHGLGAAIVLSVLMDSLLRRRLVQHRDAGSQCLREHQNGRRDGEDAPHLAVILASGHHMTL
jgi:hypothetical protein